MVDPGPTVKKAFHFGAPATTANPQYAIDRYNEWKTQYYVTVENEAVPQYLRDLFPTNVAGSARIKFDNDSFTVSEGIGYGMLNAYFMSDWDGSGYPLGLIGEEIHIFGRIVALADVFDALCNTRVYKEAWPLDTVIAHVKERAGTQFDPQLIAVFLEHIERFVAILNDNPNESA